MNRLRTLLSSAMVLYMSLLPSSSVAADASFASFDVRAKAGGNLNVVFLGGSLTWGANATDPQLTSYRALVSDHLRRAYPKAHFGFWDAAIGGTGSQLAIFRLDRDVLARNPDLVFVDFAINDDIYSDSAETNASYEALVRRLISEAQCPVMTVILAAKANVRLGELPKMHRRGVHLAIANAYHTGVGDAVAYMTDRVRRGLIDPEDLWLPYDSCHPNDAGYAEYAQAVWEGFQNAIADRLICQVPETWLYADTYQHSCRFRISTLSRLPAGWSVGRPHRNSLAYDLLMSRWLDDEVVASPSAQQPVEPLKVQIHGSAVLLYGEATRQSGNYRVSVDDKQGPELSAASPDGNARLVEMVATGLDPQRPHILTIQPVLAPGQELRLESICVAGSKATVDGSLFAGSANSAERTPVNGAITTRP